MKSLRGAVIRVFLSGKMCLLQRVGLHRNAWGAAG